MHNNLVLPFLYCFCQFSIIASAQNIQNISNNFQVPGLIFVEDFGANGNDEFDDSEAFTKAIKASKGSTLYLKGGRYRANFRIDSSDTHIVGNGATITAFNPNKPVVQIGSQHYITDISLEDLKILGTNNNADGILITNNSIKQGADFIHFKRLIVERFRNGIHITGRSIWSRFEKCRFDWNETGFKIKTKLPCNLLYFDNCTFNNNQKAGAWIENENAAKESFIAFQFSSCNFEANGKNADTAYGAYFSGLEGLTLENIYCENNGQINNVNFGIKISGLTGRGIQINSGWYVGSKYPIYIDGAKKSGTIQGVTAHSLLDNQEDIFILAEWLNDEPKVEVRNCFAGVVTASDKNGNLPVPGIDWHTGNASKISFRNRNWLKVMLTENQRITTIYGLLPGKEIGLINYTNNNKVLVVNGALMFDSKDFTIEPNKTQKFIVDGYPTLGKLRPL